MFKGKRHAFDRANNRRNATYIFEASVVLSLAALSHVITILVESHKRRETEIGQF